MISLLRTDSTNTDFIELVKQLDAYLAIIDGEEHAFYNQFNKVANLKYVIVAYENEVPVGCGALKEFSVDTMEVKRMYVLPKCRGKGIASKILAQLEKCTKELNYSKCVLETGKKQVDAVALYTKSGYHVIQNYGQYLNIDASVCFEKFL